MRQQSLKDRKERLEKEEHARVLLDMEFKREEELKRQDAVNRAKQLQYMETDMVKDLHTKLNMMNTLEVVYSYLGA
jgi:hypothetical protein